MKIQFGNWSSSKLSTSVLLALVLIALTGCPRDNKPQPPPASVSNQPTSAPSNIVPAGVAFNGERAMEHVRKQVEIGPRPPGSPELARAREYIVAELKKYGLAVRFDDFKVSTPVGERNMTNITAELPGESSDVIIIASHYDTKFYKDMHFVGANDPGTSVATLLEIGRVLTGINQKPKLTYWLVFFDGEEAFCEGWEDCGKPDTPDNTYGSRRYVSDLQSKSELSRVRAMILLDLMGSKDLELGRDTMSTRWLQDIVWQTGRQLGHGSVFVDRPEGVGGDDHEPFLRAGIDSLDIIQLNTYEHWHKATDTIDKVSAQSMKIVGDVVLNSLPKVEQRVLSRRK